MAVKSLIPDYAKMRQILAQNFLKNENERNGEKMLGFFEVPLTLSLLVEFLRELLLVYMQIIK